METAMSDLSLTILATGAIVLVAAYGLKRLGKWFDKNREKFEQMQREQQMKHKH